MTDRNAAAEPTAVVMTRWLTDNGVDVASNLPVSPVMDPDGTLAGYRRWPEVLYVTAAVNGVVVAASGAWLLEHPVQPPVALVVKLSVDPPGERLGLERRLLDAIELEAGFRGCAEVRLRQEVADVMAAVGGESWIARVRRFFGVIDRGDR